jgi:hypothetical protein
LIRSNGSDGRAVLFLAKLNAEILAKVMAEARGIIQAAARSVRFAPAIMADDIFPAVDDASGGLISKAAKFAFSEGYGAAQINDFLLSCGAEPRKAKDISLNFEDYRRTFLGVTAVAPVGRSIKSGIETLCNRALGGLPAAAVEGRGILSGLGAVTGLAEEAPILLPKAPLWSVGLSKPTASFGYKLGSRPWIASVPDGGGVVQTRAKPLVGAEVFAIAPKVPNVGSYGHSIDQAMNLRADLARSSSA